MTDHPVLVPTAEGPVGGIVSEPRGEPRGALMLLPGYGRPARSGINSFWARLARECAELGLVVLRVDYSREGETLPIGIGVSGQVAKRALDMRLLEQVLPWFRSRIGDLGLLLAGSCSGARAAIELGGREPAAIAGILLIAPYLRALAGSGPAEPNPDELPAVDPLLVELMQAVLDRAPAWILAGEHDTADLPLLQRLLGPTRQRLELEVVPGMALHLLDKPALQAEVRARLLARVERALSGDAPARPRRSAAR